MPDHDASPDPDKADDAPKDSAPDKPREDSNDDAQDKDKDKEKKKDQPSPLKRPGVRIGLAIAACVLLIGGGIWLIEYLTTGRYMEETDDATIAADSVTIAPKVSGYVDQLLVADNQDVQAGQALVRIDPRDYQAKAAQARSQIDVSTANADAVRAQIREQQAAIAQARAQLAAAHSSAAFALSEAERFAPLARSGAETTEQLASKRNDARKAADEVASQQAALASAERRVATLQAQVRQAQAQGETAAAQLASASVDVQSTTVTAAVAGRVGDLTVRVGQFVQSGMRLMSVVPVTQLYITANFKETQIGRMRRGQPVTIKVDALSGFKLHGRVDSISPGTGAEFSLLPPQNATGNFTKIVQRIPVRISLDSSEATRRVLVPGLSVTATVDTISAKQEYKAMREDEKARQEDRQ